VYYCLYFSSFIQISSDPASLVAQKILSQKEHRVELGDCAITVQAKPIQFLVPDYVEVTYMDCMYIMDCIVLLWNIMTLSLSIC